MTFSTGMSTEKFLINILFEEFKLSLTTEKIDVSSAKSLGLESNPLGKLFMYTKKNNGLKIGP